MKELAFAQVQLQECHQIWNLQADGDAFASNSGLLQPVIYEGIPAMLKIMIADEERRAAKLMVHYAGNAAVKVLQHQPAALLMERAKGRGSLAEMARCVSDKTGDDQASRIICAVAAKLHQTIVLPTLQLIPLSAWFKSLFFAAEQLGGVFVSCAETARLLLNKPMDEVVLHGDLHHGNVLDAEERGWLAIDPKALYGERGFDFANLFCNPDSGMAIQPGRLSRQLNVVAAAANLDPKRLLQWVLAWAGLSTAWMLEDGKSIAEKLQFISIALSELDRY
ncbi:aminoglycoside phosphotransferase family protein [Pedobacter gandavensis]|uniref:aminoglycoside phosphotransferase family protein n=1 Tax=Pedobacter gandavensis TaxID=2679963 RepID=UPI002930A25C|nr:aminoglycoside phosphotransferase family protein [Pedobacter gandavensis]